MVDDIGNLKEWLQGKAKVFEVSKNAEAYDIPILKGILIATTSNCSDWRLLGACHR